MFCAFLSLITVLGSLILDFMNGNSRSGLDLGFYCFLPMCFFFVGMFLLLMAPQVLHPHMVSILFFLTSSFALPPAVQLLAQEQVETIEEIRSPDDLDPETRRRYEEAREKLREADRLLASAMHEIERELPALALAL